MMATIKMTIIKFYIVELYKIEKSLVFEVTHSAETAF